MDQFFIETRSQLLTLEKEIKNNKTDNVITVIILKGDSIKSFIWFLLREDISFKREAAGAGIAIFHVDTTLNFFVKPKKDK